MNSRSQPILFLGQTPRDVPSLLERAARPVAGYCAGPKAGSDADQWREAGFSPLPEGGAADDNRHDFLADMLLVADALALENGRAPLWWATDIASRNRFESPLTPLLNAYADALASMRAARRDGRDLALVGLPGPVLRQVALAAPALGFQVLSAQSAWALLAERLRGELAAWRELAADLRESLRRIRVVARSKERTPSPLPTGPVTLIKTFVYPGCFDEQGAFRDPFFGPLPAHLARALGPREELVTIGVGFNDEQQCARRMRAVPGAKVLPLEDFLRPADAVLGCLHVVLHRLLRPFRAPQAIRFLGHPADTLVAECLRGGGWRISLFQYLHRAAGRRLGRALSLSFCLTTFEGNPWERMLLLGLRESSPGLFCLGYQHAVVPPAAAGVFATPAELALCPLPDRVLTTGEPPARMLLELGAWPGERLAVACALRQSFPDIPPFPEGPFTVMVAMEGVRETLPLLRHALEQAACCPETRFLLRTHPLMPLPRLLEELGLAGLPPNVVSSKEAPLLEDIAACHAVLYWGTTVSMEALALGRPVIHFDNGLRPSYDPLHGFDDFKWTTSRGRPLAAALDAIRALPRREADRRAGLGREHVLRFFRPPTPEALDAFRPSKPVPRFGKGAPEVPS